MNQVIKKLVVFVAAAAIVITGLPSQDLHAATAPANIEVLLNARKISFPDARPFQDSQGSVMVPIRMISDALGADIVYSKVGGVTSLTVKDTEHMVNMTVGQTQATANGKTVDYGTKIVLKQNRTFVPLRLVSEGLGQKIEWDKVGRWVWIGERTFRSTDDAEFKLQPLSKFATYLDKSPNYLEGENYKGVKVIKESDLPILIPTYQGEVIYSIKRVKRIKGRDFLEMRSNLRGTPIGFLVKNDFIKGRGAVDNAFVYNGDKTGMNYYPVISQSDFFQNREYVDTVDYESFKFKTADYILFREINIPYIVVMINPFK